ncbi:MAG: hypothetical protein U0V49_07450 [Saprospiraceae bacterium]
MNPQILKSSNPQIRDLSNRINRVLILFRTASQHFSIVPFVFIFLGLNGLTKHVKNPEFGANDSVNKLAFNTNLSCTRNDVDPCTYLTNGAFASALVAELNSVVNGCPAPTECGPNQCCTDEINVNFLTQYSGLNPWIYCSSRTDCDPYDCGSFGTMCNYADVTLQDLMMGTARSYAMSHIPGCATRIRNMQFYIVSFSSTNCTIIQDCYNLEIYFHAEYYSCNCE